MPYTYSTNGINYYSGNLFSALAPGTYTVYVKDVNGCIGTVQVTVEQTQGIDDQNGLTITTLYPNPNQGKFDLEIHGVIGDEIDGKLFNVEGKLVASFRLGAQNGVVKNTLELSDKISAGTYYLGIYNGSRAAVVRLVKE